MAPPCPITRIYRFRYSSIFTRIRYLLCISLILPRQFHAKREIANDVRDGYIIFFHFVFARTRSVRAVEGTKKQIRNCILLILNSRHSYLPIPLSLYVHANMLYPLSLFLLPHQICLRQICALRSRLLYISFVKSWEMEAPCPITRIYQFRYSSIFTRIRYLLCISLILPRQFHAKREIANDVRDRYIIFFHFVFVRTRSVRAVGSTKKQIQLRICFFVAPPVRFERTT